MRRVRIKVCGLREPDKAAAIAAAGADAIGLVFADSPRQVTAEQARAVVQALPPLVWAVGVFVNRPADEINRIADQVGLHALQLHGEEPPDIVANLSRPVIKAFRVKDADFLEEVRRWAASVRPGGSVAGILLDAWTPDRLGGTGETFNWDLIAQARRTGALDGLPPLILSGGLNEANVAAGIEQARPWAVDVSSGVESAPGVKDLDKARRFIAAVQKVPLGADGSPSD